MFSHETEKRGLRTMNSIKRNFLQSFTLVELLICYRHHCDFNDHPSPGVEEGQREVTGHGLHKQFETDGTYHG